MSKSEDAIDKEVKKLLTWCSERKQEIQRGQFHGVYSDAETLLTSLNPSLTKEESHSKDDRVKYFNHLLRAEVFEAFLHLTKNNSDTLGSLKEFFYRKNGTLSEDELRIYALMSKPHPLLTKDRLKKIEYKRYHTYRVNNGFDPDEINSFQDWKLSDRDDCLAFPQYYPNPFADWDTKETSKIMKAVGGGCQYHYNKYKKSLRDPQKVVWNDVLRLLITKWTSTKHRNWSAKFTIKLVLNSTMDMLRLNEKYLEFFYLQSDDMGKILYENNFYSWNDLDDIIKREKGDWSFIGFQRMLYVVYHSLNDRPLDPAINEKIVELIEAVFEIDEDEDPYYKQELPHSISTLVDELIAIDNDLHHKGIDQKYKDDRGFVRTMVPTELW